jgi:hypothetical protein
MCWLTLNTWFNVAFCAGVVENALTTGDAKRGTDETVGPSSGRRNGIDRKLRKNAVAMVMLLARDNLAALSLDRESCGTSIGSLSWQLFGGSRP